MQRQTELSFRWLESVWRRKDSLIGGLLAVASLSLAHYAGFLIDVPLQIIAVGGMSLAPGVTATFYFYIFFCGVLARVITSAFQMLFLPLIAATDRAERGVPIKLDWPKGRRFVWSHTRTIKWEGKIWITVQAFVFVALLLAVYIKFTVTVFSILALTGSILFVLLAGLVRSGFFLQPKASAFTRKLKTRPAHASRFASAAFITGSAAAVVLSFFVGAMRMNLLSNQVPQWTVTNSFSGLANVIGSSDGTLLMLQKDGSGIRYIYSSPEFATSFESPGSKFPKLEATNLLR